MAGLDEMSAISFNAIFVRGCVTVASGLGCVREVDLVDDETVSFQLASNLERARIMALGLIGFAPPGICYGR